MTAIRTETNTDAAAWRAETLVPEGGRFHLDAACRDELIRAAGDFMLTGCHWKRFALAMSTCLPAMRL